MFCYQLSKEYILYFRAYNSDIIQVDLLLT